MPRAGLSLLGFMDQDDALNYLRSWCVPVDDSDIALIAEWHAARAARGNPTPNAGNPDMQPLSTAHPYVQQLMQGKWAPVFARWEGVPALPFVGVARYNNRCYLTNGFHGAIGIRSAGATHMPCVFRDLQSVDDIGFRNDGRTFTPSLLESEDPPTLAHFARGRAHAVSLRTLSRVLHVSWPEYAVPEE
jgi:hypothetical protein